MSFEENNKIIAEFMGGKMKGESLPSINDALTSNSIWLPFWGIKYFKHLKYHSSWDWLIPVVNKITDNDSYARFKEYSSSVIHDGGVFVNTNSINDTYKDVVEFIKWHNDQRK